jgi:hypothetical protein
VHLLFASKSYEISDVIQLKKAAFTAILFQQSSDIDLLR